MKHNQIDNTKSVHMHTREANTQRIKTVLNDQIEQ